METGADRGGTESYNRELYPLTQVFVQLCCPLLFVVPGEVVPESGERPQVGMGYCGRRGNVFLSDA